MKNNYSSFGLWLCALAVLLCTGPLVQAQTWTPSSTVTVCPGEVGSYTLSGVDPDARLTGTSSGAVVGGTLLNTPTLANGRITYQVRWNDFQFKGAISANIEVPTRDANGKIIGYSPIDQRGYLTVLIRSVKDLTAPSVAASVPFCATAPFSVSLPVQTFTNVPTEQVPAYLWEVPATWAVSGATLIPSFASTPSNFRLYQGTRTITLTPQPGGDVSLRVFGYNSNCNQANSSVYPLYTLISAPGTVTISRQPTVAVTSGPRLVYCGDQTPKTYAAQVSQPQGVAGYSWSYPSGWAVQGSATGSSITLVPNGTNGGEVRAQATYACASPALVVTSPAVRVDFSANLTPVKLLELPNLCDGQTATLHASQVPGASSYQWTLPPGALVPTTVAPTSPGGNQYLTASPAIEVRGYVNPYQGGGLVTVSVAAGGSGCGSSSTAGTLIVGLGAQAVLGTSVPTSTTNGYTVCANQPIQFLASVDQQQAPITGYSWTVNGQPYYPAEGQASLSAYTPAAGQSLTVSVYMQSSCGALQVGQSVIAAGSVDGLPCEAARPGRSPVETQEVAVYPNPANDQLIVESAGGRVRLFNSYGQPVVDRKSVTDRLVIDTQRLPTGLYFLETETTRGNAKRIPVRVDH